MKDVEDSKNKTLERKERNAGIDCLRVIFMLAICVLHAFSMSGRANGCESRVWSFAIVGFAFISGYYGLIFRPSKLLQLWGMAILLVMIPVGLAWKVGWLESSILLTYRNFLFSNWYLNAYSILLLLSPLVTKGIDSFLNDNDLSDIRWGGVIPLLFLLLWSWFSELYFIREFVPIVPGMGRQSFMALLYIYVFGRYYSKYKWFSLFSIRKTVLILIGLIPLMMIFGSNTSPVTIIFTMVLFRVFERISLPQWLIKVVTFLGPSMFAVYLLHTNFFGFDLIHRYVSWMIDDLHLFRYVAFFICGITLFVVCCSIDMFRRVIRWLGSSLFSRCWRKLDSFYETCVKVTGCSLEHK